MFGKHTLFMNKSTFSYLFHKISLVSSIYLFIIFLSLLLQFLSSSISPSLLPSLPLSLTPFPPSFTSLPHSLTPSSFLLFSILLSILLYLPPSLLRRSRCSVVHIVGDRSSQLTRPASKNLYTREKVHRDKSCVRKPQ